MIIFVDFETDMEMSIIKSIAFVNEKRHESVELNENEHLTLDLWLNMLKKVANQEIAIESQKIYETGEKIIIIFWHHFLPVFLAKNHEDIYNHMHGRYITFCDYWAARHGMSTIANITMILLDREHKGQALQDALDLRDCYLEELL